jgi:aminopeptidase N
VLLLVWVTIAAENPDYAIERNGMSVKEFHQRLAESKAAAYGNGQFAAAMAARQELDIHQESYDVKLYDVFIRIDDTAEVIYGSVGILAEATEASVEEVQVDFHVGMTVDSVVAPSGNLSYSHTDDYIYVTLDRPYMTGEQLEFCVYYHGYPELGGVFYAEFFFKEDSGVIINTMSEPYGSRYFWPCKDRPDDKPDSMNIVIEVDTSLWVATNGVLDSVVYNGSNSETYYYSVRYPMATYLFALSITDFIVWTDYYYYNAGQDSMPIVNAVYPDLLLESVQGWGIAPEALTIFADNFGEYPFIKEKYGHASVMYAGMEHQTVTAACGCDFGFTEYLVIHEMAHHWWGNMITCKSWQDIWLNEGWGTYSEAVYYKDIYGWDYYRDYMNSLAYWGGGTIYVDDTTDAHRIFNAGLSYYKLLRISRTSGRQPQALNWITLSTSGFTAPTIPIITNTSLQCRQTPGVTMSTSWLSRFKPPIRRSSVCRLILHSSSKMLQRIPSPC